MTPLSATFAEGKYAFLMYWKMEIRLLTMPCNMACSYCPVDIDNGLVVYIAIEVICVYGEYVLKSALRRKAYI